MAQIEATTLITFNPPSVRDEDSLGSALELMSQWQLAELPVINKRQQVLGILQLEALVDVIRNNRSLVKQPAEEHITARPDPFVPHRFPQIALQQLLSENLRSLPVVEDGKLIGTLGRSDFLREFALTTSRLAQSTVMDRCVTHGDGLEAKATVEEAFQQMDSERTDHVCLVQSGCPLAACTRDELRLAISFLRAEELLGGEPSKSRSVIKLIRQAPHLQPGQTMGDAAMTMSETGATALLVVNKANRILGVLTESIILSVLLRGGV